MTGRRRDANQERARAQFEALTPEQRERFLKTRVQIKTALDIKELWEGMSGEQQQNFLQGVAVDLASALRKVHDAERARIFGDDGRRLQNDEKKGRR